MSRKGRIAKRDVLPDPFGPITEVIPGLNSNIVLSAKDLKPCSSNLFKYI